MESRGYPTARQSALRLAWVAAGCLLLFGLLSSPTPHDVHSAGGVSINGLRIADGDTKVDFFAPIKPSMSVADVRCQMWQSRNPGVCPDETTLTRQYWPALEQSGKTLYVGVSSSCDEYNYVYGFNVEYFASDRSLLVHCYSAAPWIHLSFPCAGECPRGGGPVTMLIEVPTSPIAQGTLKVIRDDRIEHYIGDQTTKSDLGEVTIR